MRIEFEGIQVVFFDAGGTLFEVLGSVGEVYARLAAHHGIISNSEEVERSFASAYRENPPMAFPGLSGPDLDRAEREWWRMIVRRVFADKTSEERLKSYFEEVYELFRGAQPWSVFPDTRPSLERLRTAGFRLGVISNFDSRLDDVLASLGLNMYFEKVLVSSRCGAAKPDPLIFNRAADSMSTEPFCAVHIGDSYSDDYEGARRAGLRAILLDRKGESGRSDAALRVPTLDAACEILGARGPS